MVSANISRDDAAARTRVVTAQAYRITVDVRDAVTSEVRTFISTTQLDFDAAGGATHLDLIADEILHATLDGTALDTSEYTGARLPLPELAPGRHTVEVKALCRYSHSGEGLHRFVDPSDGKVYLYSQCEAPDARRIFANFEQPDQKATFEFTVIAPNHWEVFSNSATPECSAIEDGLAQWKFPTTPRMSTYITAVVAGEYHVVRSKIHTAKGTIPAAVACRQSLAEYLDAENILTTTQRGFEVFEKAFGVPYAYDSYDQIFVPEFNYGAMENIGCVTFRDEYVWRDRVTAKEIEARDNTILHELAHMWFGDLVTMRWWDDLWLNESFAEWASHFAADEIARTYHQDVQPWASFANARKVWAYHQDQLSTTHPIAADMSDLEKVEQNFDGITYAKGASVLKLLVSFVGQETFLRGVNAYFTKHAYGNTELADLLRELEAACGKDLSWFTGQWLETAGVNTLRADFDLDEQGRFTRFEIVQTAHPDYPTLRTHRLGIGLYELADEALSRRHYVELDVTGERTEVPELVGQPRRDVVLLNDGDLTYAKVRLDQHSVDCLRAHIDKLADGLARAVAFSSMWDATRDAELPPQQFTEFALHGFASEKDMAAAATILSNAALCTTRYMAPELREEANTHLVQGLARLLKRVPAGSDAQLLVARELVGAARTQPALELIAGWLRDEEVPEGLTIGTGLRWPIIHSLARAGVLQEDDVTAELRRDNTIAGSQKAAGAIAAMPNPTTKSHSWERATVDPDVPNETHRAICGNFWQYGQDEVLEPYVERYFEFLQQLVDPESMWATRGYAALGAVLQGLFPATVADEALVNRTAEWLSHNDGNDRVNRGITERIDEARRALRCQEASRRG